MCPRSVIYQVIVVKLELDSDIYTVPATQLDFDSL